MNSEEILAALCLDSLECPLEHVDALVRDGIIDRNATSKLFWMLREQIRETEKDLRYELWLHHGHPFQALYGDDGEMQCGMCPADFKRMPLDELRELVRVRRMEAAAAAGRELGL